MNRLVAPRVGVRFRRRDLPRRKRRHESAGIRERKDRLRQVSRFEVVAHDLAHEAGYVDQVRGKEAGILDRHWRLAIVGRFDLEPRSEPSEARSIAHLEKSSP